MQPFIVGYGPGVWSSSDMRFAYRELPGFRSSNSSVKRTISAEKQKPYKLVVEKGAPPENPARQFRGTGQPPRTQPSS
jgi:hypothetical protein